MFRKALVHNARVRLLQLTPPVKTVGVVTPGMAQKAKPSATAASYLNSSTTLELLLYAVIGAATLNKPILDMVIKVFPYVPMWLVKTLVYRNYCGGETMAELRATANRLANRNIHNMMLLLTIEGCDGDTGVSPQLVIDDTIRSITEVCIPHTVAQFKAAATPAALNLLPASYIAIKPTGFAPNAAAVLANHTLPEYARQFETLVANCAQVCQVAFDKNAEMRTQFPSRVAPAVVVTVDAEKYDLQPGVYELQRRLFARFNPAGQPVLVAGTIQMYLKHGLPLLELETALAKAQGYRLGLKLVRGAYVHLEPDRSVIHDTKANTDAAYDAGITQAIQAIVTPENTNNELPVGHLMVALHNGDLQRRATQLVRELLELMAAAPQAANVSMGQLLGMADDVTFDLVERYGVTNVVKYVPWGPPKETREYLLRRLEENGDAVRADSGWGLIKRVGAELVRRVRAA